MSDNAAPLPKQLLITLLVSISVLIVVVLVSIQSGMNMQRLTNDGSFISDLGALLWCVAASICIFASVLLRNTQSTKELSKYLFYSGILTTYLLCDDFFQIHDSLLHNKLGISEKLTYVVLGTVVIAYIVKFWRIILQTNYIVLLTALGFLGISVISDGILLPIEITYGVLAISCILIAYFLISNFSLHKEYIVTLTIVIALLLVHLFLIEDMKYSEYLFEEGAKWIGICVWCSYYVQTAYSYSVIITVSSECSN